MLSEIFKEAWIALGRNRVRSLLTMTGISWGIVAGLTGFIHTAPQFYGVRLLLGVAEAGFFPLQVGPVHAELGHQGVAARFGPVEHPQGEYEDGERNQ